MIWKVNYPLGPPAGAFFKTPRNVTLTFYLLAVLEIITFLLLIVAAFGPGKTSRQTLITSRGADIYFVLDISPSMAALDMDGGTEGGLESRFSAAKSLIIDFAEKRPADSIGIIAVGSNAALALPACLDRNALSERLGTLQLGELGGGSALSMGLSLAALHIEPSPAAKKAVVLITDGENNAGSLNPLTAARMVREAGAKLYTIGLGTSGDVPIDYTDPFTKARQQGRFHSHFDADALRSLAEAGGGSYIPAQSMLQFATALEDIGENEWLPAETGLVVHTVSQTRYFLLAALALFSLVWLGRRFGLSYGFHPKELYSKWRFILAFCTTFLAFTCIIIGIILPPREKTESYYSNSDYSLDMCLVFDISRSMELENRFKKGLEIANNLISSSNKPITSNSFPPLAGGIEGGEIRYSSIIGKSDGFIALPLSADREALASLLRAMNEGNVLTQGQGTNLSNLIDKAGTVFQDTSPAKRLMVLFSDGEALEGSLAEAAGRAAAKDIAIAAVGLGTEAGVPVPWVQGHTSRLDKAAMENAASITGGVYINGFADNAVQALEDYCTNLPEIAASGMQNGKKGGNIVSPANLLALLAMLFLGLAKLAGTTRKNRMREYDIQEHRVTKTRIVRRGRARPAPTGGIAAVAMVMVLFSACNGSLVSSGNLAFRGSLDILAGNFYADRGNNARALSAYSRAASDSAASAYALYNSGLLLLQSGDDAAAMDYFNRCIPLLNEKAGTEGYNAELSYALYYNRGLINFRSGNYDAAAGDFRNALKADNSKTDAKINLELSLLSISYNEEAQANTVPVAAKEDTAGNIIFNYMRQKEDEQWKQSLWVEESSSEGPDY
ncbi:MAG: VWA domain-containing protein [Spirochaetaceae bacterium]|nr:VWA domain-containing protein [Spirochaetaceae bacterium]